ncbi:MAG: FixH family protein [Pseudomonadota bacterium]
MKVIQTVIFVCLVQALFCTELQAHGSITAEGDLCVLRIGFYTAHFKVFQPDTSQEKEFCEDLPAAGSSIFVMEYLHQSLGAVPIEFRIIHDTTGLGRFARLEDIEKISDLDAVTVFHQPPVIESQVFSVLHDFAEEGDFVGIVTVKHPDTEQHYSAVFPFHVGAKAWGYLPLLAVIAILSHVGYLFFSGAFRRFRRVQRANNHPLHYKSWLNKASLNKSRLNNSARKKSLLKQVRFLMFVPALLLTFAANADSPNWLSESGNIKLSFSSAVEPLPLNRIHEWTLHLETLSGVPIENAKVYIKGGMPAHNHGLPTDPVVTQYLGNGNYRVEGVRFHMQGDWVLEVSITDGNNQHDTVLVSLTL